MNLTSPRIAFPARRVALLMLALVGWAPAALAQPAERRVALVVGVGAYQSAPPLAYPVKDARAIGEALRRLGFEVDEVLDPDYRTLFRGVRAFGIKAQRADVAVVYYTGHGVQVGRENYLLPIDSRLERERDLLYETVSLELLLGEVSQTAKAGVVMLDASRRNPFTGRMAPGSNGAASPGLAGVDPVPSNTMVVLAAKPNAVSEDGDAGQSSFAKALQVHFAKPGLELGPFFNAVRDTVRGATGGRQEPQVFSSLSGNPFYFLPGPPNRIPVLAALLPLELRENAGPTPLGIAPPSDPDQDAMTVRVTALPTRGEVLLAGRALQAGAVFPAERVASIAYKPEPGSTGAMGAFDLLVEDGRGGFVMGSIPITVLPSNLPPLAEAPRRLRIHAGPLGIAAPTDPDGDSLTVIVMSVPRGQVRGASAVNPGDRLRPEALAALTYIPDAGASGRVGTFNYEVDDGRGGFVQSGVEVEVVSPAEAATAAAEQVLWERVRTSTRIEDLDAFTRFYPNSGFAPAAASRRAELTGAPATPAPPERLALLQAPRTTTDASRPAPNDATVQDCPTCPVLSRIPAGSFTMGGPREPASLPSRRVTLRPFLLAQEPVTVADWQACRAGGGCTGSMPRLSVTDPATPMHNLSWDDAQAYVAWLSLGTGRAYRLPTEAEWEYATRANTTTRYWWGDQPGTAQANCADCGGTQDSKVPAPARTFAANAWGLHGMGGGVAQWVQDCWAPNYTGAPTDGSAREAGACPQRVLRGGSFKSGAANVSAGARASYDAPVRYYTNGMRVARNAD